MSISKSSYKYTVSVLAMVCVLGVAPFSAATTKAAVPALPKVVLFLGDSYSEGQGAGQTSNRFTSLTAAAMGWTEVNMAQGCTGYTAQCWVKGKLHVSYPAVLPAINFQPDIVIVSGGRNDQWKPMTSATIYWFYSNLRAKFPSAQLFATSPIWGASTKPPAKLQLLQSAVQTATRANGATYIDLGNPLMGHPKLMAKDALHPNARGHAAIATALVRGLQNTVAR